MKPAHPLAFVSALCLSHAHAQTELIIKMYEISHLPDGDALYGITAELTNPTGTILAAISDLSFTVDQTNIHNFQYNPAFDSDFFGPALVDITPTGLTFTGTNTLPPLNNPGGTDSSNPLQIATFEADDFHLSSLPTITILGQLTGAYSGVPFPEILVYQNADGSPGDVPFRAFFSYIPAPSSASLLCLGGLAAARRRCH